MNISSFLKTPAVSCSIVVPEGTCMLVLHITRFCTMSEGVVSTCHENFVLVLQWSFSWSMVGKILGGSVFLCALL
jgi:intracellular septation protein A